MVGYLGVGDDPKMAILEASIFVWCSKELGLQFKYSARELVMLRSRANAYCSIISFPFGFVILLIMFCFLKLPLTLILFRPGCPDIGTTVRRISLFCSPL